jgi:retron-type reverse transcriptase
MLKLLTRILTTRLTQEIDHLIPEHQFGFRRGRSTLHAVNNLLKDIDEALKMPKGKFYTIVIDYTKAFDLLNRKKLLTKLENLIGTRNPHTVIVKNILAHNTVVINDTVSTSKDIIQTNGVLQGDPLSPLLFNVATSDIAKTLQLRPHQTVIYMYADDMVIGSTNKTDLQNALNDLANWADENDFEVNQRKTVKMVFRKGGRVAADDNVSYKNATLETVNTFKYIGITLQTTNTTFRIHIKEKTTAAIKAIYDIKEIAQLSLKTAMALFNNKIVPILTYGIDIIWDKLKLQDLAALEKVKARFLKKSARRI